MKILEKPTLALVICNWSMWEWGDILTLLWCLPTYSLLTTRASSSRSMRISLHDGSREGVVFTFLPAHWCLHCRSVLWLLLLGFEISPWIFEFLLSLIVVTDWPSIVSVEMFESLWARSEAAAASSLLSWKAVLCDSTSSTTSQHTWSHTSTIPFYLNNEDGFSLYYRSIIITMLSYLL